MKSVILINMCMLVFLVGCQRKSVTSDAFIQETWDHRKQYGLDFINNDGPLKDAESIAKMQYYDPNQSYVCTCAVTRDNAGKALNIPTYAGKEKEFKVFGTATCQVKGESIRLTMLQYAQYYTHPIYSKKLFVPFKDYTNGETTYGGGRYLDLSIDNVDADKITIDFNKTYNPYCAYSDGYNCPIPPKENHLEVKIEAGEKLYKKED